ncbi:efflux RND transporter permease subunit [Paenibacillus sp. WQ 127069]|uniref:Efflux RND transporter permease subunit n=1 Tax=Paenibacillus baimaensis TaxID=2982185 RepID=A0ABT2UDG6_9BACL|nr:efflux RND transporter permease subunit [Paenibacillus sp. WQ 127069]MCU6792676.1 efflux RND transporter permease subunit [Paenibacillus sp. WQ 127069]
MDRLIKFSMKNVAALFIIMILLFAGGIYSAKELKVENLPDISLPIVIVTTEYIGSPKDVMDEVTEPIEEKFANIKDLEKITSKSSDSFSTVVVSFIQGVDTDKKKQEIESLLQEVELPDAAKPPKVSTMGLSSSPSNYLVAYTDNGMSQEKLDQLYSDIIEPRLLALNGIDHLDAIGARDSSLDIELNADALNYYGLTPSQVTTFIRAAVTKSSVGTVKLSGNEKMARVTGDITSLVEIENIEITTNRHGTILLSQVASLKSIMESDFNSRFDGKPAIGIVLYKASSANAVEFSDAINAQIEEWKISMPNVTFKSTFDGSHEIKESINGLLREGIVGAILAALMILIFLRNVRMTLIVLVSIPLSIMITLLLMWQLGLTLNTMTLGGIFIAVGRVVDDSIVVIENIYVSLEKAQKRNESVILLATKQVSSAITSSTLATAGVFAPMGLVSGIIGEVFKPFSITLAAALLSSLLVALTVIPLLAKLLVLQGTHAHASHEDEKPGRILTFYRNVLEWSLTHRIRTLLLSVLLFVVTIASVYPFLKITFLPDGKPSNTMYFQLKLPNDTSFDTMDGISKELEGILMETKDIHGNKAFHFVEALVGYNGDGDQQAPNAAQIYVEANGQVDAVKLKDEVKDLILTELPPGSEIESKSLGGENSAASDFEYSLRGEDQKLLEAAAGRIKEKLKEFSELSEIEDNLSDAKMEVQIAVDQKKARTYGLNASTVRDTARSWIQKQELGDLKFDNLMYTTTVSMNTANTDSLEKLGNISFTSSTGTTVFLKEVAKISEVKAPATLSREGQKQTVSVTAKINNLDKNGVSKRVSHELQNVELPDGVSREVKGVSSDINESFTQLIAAMAVAIAIVYLIMVLAFGNASAPFAILFSLPLAAIGGLIGLVAINEPLSVTSMVGFMMLIGIVVTNAIVLIDRAQQLQVEGYTVRHALLEAGRVRLRPIIMTAGATITALIPLALGLSGEGELIGKGLGIVVIGGLVTSTVLTLVVVPVVYEMLDSIKIRMSQAFKRNNKKSVLDETGTLEL